MTVKVDGAKLKIRDVVRVARPGAKGRFEKAVLDPQARERIAATRAYIDQNWMHDDAPLMYAFNTGVGLFKDQRVLIADMAAYQQKTRLCPRDRRRRALQRGRDARHDAAARQRLRVELFRPARRTRRAPDRVPQCRSSSGHPAKGLGRRIRRSRAARPHGRRGVRLRGSRDDLQGPPHARARGHRRSGLRAGFRARREGCLGAHQRLDDVARAWRARDPRCPALPETGRHRHVPVARSDARRTWPPSIRACTAPVRIPARLASRAICCASSTARSAARRRRATWSFPTKPRQPGTPASPRVQDVYSLRCTPQVHGPAVEAIEYVERIVGTEINSATDNPLIFDDGKGGYVSISGGHFHGQYVAQAMDLLGDRHGRSRGDLRAPPRAPHRPDDVLRTAAQPACRQARPQHRLRHGAMLDVGARDGKPRPRDARLGRFDSRASRTPRITCPTRPGAAARRAPSSRTSSRSSPANC